MFRVRAHLARISPRAIRGKRLGLLVLLVLVVCLSLPCRRGWSLPDDRWEGGGKARTGACEGLQDLDMEDLFSSAVGMDQILRWVDCHQEEGTIDRILGQLQALSSHRPQRPNLFLAMAYASLRSGDPAKAVGFARKALASGEASPETKQVAGSILLEAGEVALASELFLEVLSSPDPRVDTVLLAKAAYNLGVAKSKAGERAEAAQAFEKAVAITHAYLPGSRLEALSRLGMGQILLSSGKPDQALDLFRASAGPLKELNEEVAWREAVQGEIAAMIRMGDYGTAERRIREILSALEAQPAETLHVFYAHLGRAHFGLGEYQLAAEAFRKALNQAVEASSPKGEILSQIHLANIDWVRGDFEKASATYKEVIREAGASGDSLAAGDGRLGLGLVAQAMGNLADAADAYRESCRWYRIAGDGRRLGTALNNLGVVQMQQGEHREASSRFEEAIRLYEDGGDEPGAALACSNLGELYRRAGRLGEARDAQEKALRLFARMNSRRGQALSHLRMGQVRLDHGEGEFAYLSYQEARRLAGEMEEADLEWRALYGMGLSNERAGRPEDALKYYLRAVEVLEARYEEMGPPSLELLVGIEAEDLYEAVIRNMIQQHREDEAFGYLQRNHKRERIERVGTWVADGSPEFRALMGQVVRNRGRLAAYRDAQERLERDRPERMAETRSEVNLKIRACRREQKKLLERVRVQSPLRYEQIMNKTFDMHEVCRKIPSDTVLIEYFMSGPELYLFTLDQEGLRAFRSPVERDHLEDSSLEMRDLILRDGRDTSAFERLKDLSAGLYEELILPIRDVLRGKHALGIVPHGELHHLPFSALLRRDKTTGEAFLLEDYRLFYLNIRDYVAFLEGGTSAPLRRDNMVGFADPGENLPGSREELLRAQEVFPDAKLFFGEDATEEKAKQISSTADVLIFALHGVFDGSGPLGSYLKLASKEGEDGKLTLAEVCRLHLNRSPLVILSACETGRGTYIRGQGRVSLADAFMMAGARSVVNTLWEVDDRATRAFMGAFYQNLKGRTVPEALRTAQLEFLHGQIGMNSPGRTVTRGVETAVYPDSSKPLSTPLNYAHPYFWGGFVAVGGWE